MIACKPQKFPVSLWIVTLTEPGDTKPNKTKTGTGLKFLKKWMAFVSFIPVDLSAEGRLNFFVHKCEVDESVILFYKYWCSPRYKCQKK